MWSCHENDNQNIKSSFRTGSAGGCARKCPGRVSLLTRWTSQVSPFLYGGRCSSIAINFILVTHAFSYPDGNNWFTSLENSIRARHWQLHLTNIAFSISGNTPLHLAILNHRKLLKFQATHYCTLIFDIHLTDIVFSGNTPLHLAARAGNICYWHDWYNIFRQHTSSPGC